MDKRAPIMKVLNAIVVVIFMAVVAIIVFHLLEDVKKEYYITINPTNKDIENKIYISGNVYPFKEVEIKSHISGVMERIMVNIGDYVKVNSSLASIQIISGSMDIEQLESSFKLTRIEYDLQEANYKRSQQLIEAGVISRSEFETAQKDYFISRQQYLSAQNQLMILKSGASCVYDSSNMVRSSISGFVIDIPVEEGASVIARNNYNVGTTLMIVADLNHFIFKAELSESYLKDIEPNDPCKITFNAYDSLYVPATINKIASRSHGISDGTVKYSVEADFYITQEMPVIRSGYSATAEILLDKEIGVLSLEEKFIRFSNDSVFVYVLDTIENKPIKRLIKIGISDGINAEVLGGLNVNDRIITNYTY